MIAQWYTIGGNYHFCIIVFIFIENNDLLDICLVLAPATMFYYIWRARFVGQGFLCRTTVLHLNAVFSQPLSKKLSFCALILAISQFWLKQHPCQLNLPKAQVDILKCLVLFLQNLKDEKKINVVIRMALSRAHTPTKPNSPAQFNQTYSKFKPA